MNVNVTAWPPDKRFHGFPATEPGWGGDVVMVSFISKEDVTHIGAMDTFRVGQLAVINSTTVCMGLSPQEATALRDKLSVAIEAFKGAEERYAMQIKEK